MSQVIVNWGILGTSPISDKIAKAIMQSSTSKLAAIGSRTAYKAKSFAEKYAIEKYYDDYDLLLKDSELDAIYLGLPNHLHAEWVIRCANAGKHVLCEKPFATTFIEAQDMVDMVKQSNVFCMEALMYRCHPFTQRLVEIIRNNVIGQVRLIQATYMADIVKVANPMRGGCILNLGCYPVSLVRLLMRSEPLEVTAMNVLSAEKHDRQASLLMRFDRDVLAVVNTADNIGTYAVLQVFGTEGHLEVVTNPWMPEQEENKIIIHRHDEKLPIVVTVNADRPLYTYQIDAINQRITHSQYEKTIDIVTLEDSLNNMAVLDAWQQQMTMGRIVMNSIRNNELV